MNRNDKAHPEKRNTCSARLWRAAAVLLALAVWQVLSVCLHQNILLPSPWQVCARLGSMWRETGFLRTVLYSAGRICGGLLAGIAAGILLGGAASRHRHLELLLQPWITAAKSVPVAAFIVILLIWISGRRLSVLIAALVVLPIVYQNVLTGCRAADPQMREMAEIFRLTQWERLRMVTWPALYPYLYAACRTAAGMAWKAGIAAEILGTPQGSIGKQIYLAKTILDTETLLAWTVMAVLLGVLSEKAALWLLYGANRFLLSGPARAAAEPDTEETDDSSQKSEETLCPVTERSEGLPGGNRMPRKPDIILSHICKSYGENRVLEDLSAVFPAGDVSIIRGPSGAGKTTLLRLIMGLEKPDSGTMAGVPERISAVFQEDRLCEQMTVLQNVLAGSTARAGRHQAEGHLREAGLGGSLLLPVSACSGGMKRRAAIVRAILAESDLVVLDEPFAGLDPETRDRTERYIERHAAGRTILLVSHEEDTEWKESALLLTGKSG